jgi:hypothetical protein
MLSQHSFSRTPPYLCALAVGHVGQNFYHLILIPRQQNLLTRRQKLLQAVPRI